MAKVTHKEKSFSLLESILDDRAFPYALGIAAIWWVFPISFGLYVILEPLSAISTDTLLKSPNEPTLIGHIVYSICGFAIIRLLYTIFGEKNHD